MGSGRPMGRRGSGGGQGVEVVRYNRYIPM